MLVIFEANFVFFFNGSIVTGHPIIVRSLAEFKRIGV